MKTKHPTTEEKTEASNTAPAAISKTSKWFSRIFSGKIAKSISMELFKSSTTSTNPIQPTSKTHSTKSHLKTTAKATTIDAKKKWTKKLECPRMPSFIPLKAQWNLSFQGLFKFFRSDTINLILNLQIEIVLPQIKS